MIRDIIQLHSDDFHTPNSLREKSNIVTDFGDQLQLDVNDLIDTFNHWKIAVGLSAPQIGINNRIAVFSLDKENTLPTVIINPTNIVLSGKKDIKKESCLSLPNVRGSVERRHNIIMDYQDITGNLLHLEAEGFLARVILHEIDHLDGILYIDRMKPTDSLERTDIKWE